MNSRNTCAIACTTLTQKTENELWGGEGERKWTQGEGRRIFFYTHYKLLVLERLALSRKYCVSGSVCTEPIYFIRCMQKSSDNTFKKEKKTEKKADHSSYLLLGVGGKTVTGITATTKKYLLCHLKVWYTNGTSPNIQDHITTHSSK